MILDLNWIGIWDNLGDEAESVDFVVICELPLPMTIFMLPGSDIHEVFFTKFYQIFPDPTHVIGQFCARDKVCDV